MEGDKQPDGYFPRELLSSLRKAVRDPLFYTAPALVLGVVGLGIILPHHPLFRPEFRSELEHQVAYCSQMLERAAGNELLEAFVNGQVTIKDGSYQGKSCGEIIFKYEVTQQENK